MDEAVRVLHVDDDPAHADLTATYLEREDESFGVETAESAAAGRERLSEGEFDCVVSDYEMPGRDGIEFLRDIRRERPDLPFILYTGRGSEEVASDAISAGATDYLQKATGPEQYELLANRIRNAVRQYRNERAQQRLLELAENTDRLIYICTSDWEDLLFVSSAFEDIWGRSIDDLRDSARGFFAGMHPDDRDRVRDAMRRVSAGETIQIEFRVNPDEEFRRWVRVRGEPIFDGGDVVRVAGFGADVTDEHRRRERRERQRETLIELATDGPVAAGDFDAAVRRITETAADVLDVARVNVWLVEDDDDGPGADDEPVLRCADHYDRRTGDHDEGVTLRAADYPTYLGALEANRALAVSDVDADPRTAELRDDYLFPHDVGALLDGTLRSEGEVVGVICHEHVGGAREWTDDEVEFASDVADVVHRALRNRQRREREAELLRRTDRLDEFASIVSEDLREPLAVADDRVERARSERDGDDIGGDEFDEEAAIGFDGAAAAGLDEAAAALERLDSVVEELEALADEGEASRGRE